MKESTKSESDKNKPRSTSNSEPLVILACRVIIGLSFIYAACVYLVDFLPSSLQQHIGRNGYSSPAVWMALAITLLYWLKLRGAVCKFLDTRVLVTLNQIPGEYANASKNPSEFLPAKQIAVCAVIAAITVAIDICLSLHYGQLSGPEDYDGVDYVLDAKRVYYGLQQISGPFDLPDYIGSGSEAWIWVALIVAGFHVLGVGMWQAATARFWPTLIMLLNVGYVTRSHKPNGARVFWMIASALLPLFSPCIRSLVWELVSGKETYVLEWLMDDLRPDLLFACLMMSTVCLSLETLPRPSLNAYRMAGVTAGLGLYVKLSAAPGTIAVLMLCSLGVLWFYRSNLARGFALILGSLSTYIVLFLIWYALGGFAFCEQYIADNVGREGVWGIPNGTYGERLLLHLNMFWHEFGQWEWLLIFVSIGVIVKRWKERDEQTLKGMLYIVIGLVLLASVASTPTVNQFLGYQTYLIVWSGVISVVESWLTIGKWAPSWKEALAYSGLLAAFSWIAVLKMPNLAKAGPDDLKVIHAIASKLATVIQPRDHFVSELFYGAPELYTSLMIDNPSLRYKLVGRWDMVMYPDENGNFDEWVRQVEQCRAVMVYEQPHAVWGQYERFDPKQWWAGYDAASQIVSSRGSGFYLAGRYTCSRYSPVNGSSSGKSYLSASTKAGRPPHDPLVIDLWIRKY